MDPPFISHSCPARVRYEYEYGTVADLYGTVLYCTSTSAVVATYSRYMQYLPVRVATYASTSGMCPLHCRTMYDYGY